MTHRLAQALKATLLPLSACLFAALCSPHLVAGGIEGGGWMSPSTSASVQETACQMREIVRLGARSSIETAVGQATDGQYRVTSSDRDHAGTLRSAAHDRGAIDIVTLATGTARKYDRASEITRVLGPGYTAVVERLVYGAGAMRITHPADLHIAYSNGEQGNQTYAPGRATGNHTHIQPNYEVGTSPTARSCTGCGAR